MSGKRCPVGARLVTVQVHADNSVRNIARKLTRATCGRADMLAMLAEAKANRAAAKGNVADHAAECEPCSEVTR